MPINRAFPFFFVLVLNFVIFLCLAVIYVPFVTRLLLVFECKCLYLCR